VRRNGVAIGGDGQVSLDATVIKGNARKLRRLHGGSVLAGFAGAAADALTLFDLFERKLEAHQGRLMHAAVALSREWRTDKMLRHLQAMLCVADLEHTLIISGNGDLIEPEHDTIAIGSGGPYAEAAARALLAHTDYDAARVVREALTIAAAICIYTNDHISVETLPQSTKDAPD